MKQIMIFLIRVYQRHISPAFPPCCRFRPTCSQYALQAIQRYGALKGGWLALKRLGCCHPFYRGKRGYFDPVP